MSQATIGEGAIVTSDAHTGQDSLANVNRDPFNTEIIIKDQQTAGLNVDANIDARVFTEAGRTQIIDEQKDIGKNAKKVTAITATDGLKVPAFIAAVTDNGNKNPDSQNKPTLDKVKDSITQIGNNNRTGMSDDTATLVATEELIVTGDITNVAAEQDTYNQLASEIASGTDAQNANVYINPDLTESRGGELGTIVLGSANETTQQDIYLDRGALDRSDGVTVANGQVEPIVKAPSTINVLNEEIAHIGGMGEASASTMGNLGEIAYNVGKWANSGDIAEAKGNIDTTAINNANTAQEQQEMLAANKERLETQQEAGDVFENRQLNNRNGRDEYWVVDQLYAKQGSKPNWSKAQIADALRSADFTKDGRTDDDEARTLLILTNTNSVSDYKDWNDHYGAEWIRTSNEDYHLPVNRNVDPILAAWINQVLTTDGDFKSYKYTWDAQNLKGNKPLPEILTPNETSSNTPSNTATEPKSTNPAQQYTDRDIENRNSAIMNHKGSIDSGSMTAHEQQQNLETFNNLVTVVEVAGLATGATEVVVGVKTVGKGIVYYIVKRKALKEARQGDIPVDDLVNTARPFSYTNSQRGSIDLSSPKNDVNVQGGAHRDTSKPTNDGFDSHHCPAKNCYQDTFSIYDGPALKLEPSDHRMTESYGSSADAKAYRQKQKELIDQGRLKDAVQMDVDVTIP